MIDAPQPRYARTAGGLRIAYETIGEGEIDLLFLHSVFSNIDMQWEDQSFAAFMRRLARSSRTIVFDSRGVGLSDGSWVGGGYGLDTLMEDMVAVLDAAGSDRAAILAYGHAGTILSCLFASNHPDRVSHLISVGGVASLADIGEHDGSTAEWTDDELEVDRSRWGSPELAREYLEDSEASRALNPSVLDWYARLLRSSLTPGAMVNMIKATGRADATPVLGSIIVPTLIVGRPELTVDDRHEATRKLADMIPGARFVDIPGRDVVPWREGSRELVDVLEAFLHGLPLPSGRATGAPALASASAAATPDLPVDPERMSGFHWPRYAMTTDGVSIAYETVGDDGPDVVLLQAAFPHLDLQWEDAPFASFVRSLSRSTRVILLNTRGCGLSDGLAAGTPFGLEALMDDLLAVLDDAGSERSAILTYGYGGVILACLFAATHPTRVSHLVLVSGAASMSDIEENDGGPITFTPDEIELERRIWGTAEQGKLYLSETEPSRPVTPELVDRFARLIRRSQSPGSWTSYMEATMIADASELLSAISAPTLVVGRPELTIDRRYAASKRLGELIPGARFADAPGHDIPPWGEGSDALIELVEGFLGHAQSGAEVDRALTTILVSFVAGLAPRTDRESAGGDDALFAPFRELVRDQLTGYHGRESRTPEGVSFAAFEGPARALRCALTIRREAAVLGLASQAGIHTGEVELTHDELQGGAVEIAAAVAAHAAPSEILVTSIVRDLVAGSGLGFDDAGSHELSVGPGPWPLFGLRDDQGQAP